jgi:hypothetical protein
MMSGLFALGYWGGGRGGVGSAVLLGVVGGVLGGGRRVVGGGRRLVGVAGGVLGGGWRCVGVVGGGLSTGFVGGAAAGGAIGKSGLHDGGILEAVPRVPPQTPRPPPHLLVAPMMNTVFLLFMPSISVSSCGGWAGQSWGVPSVGRTLKPAEEPSSVQGNAARGPPERGPREDGQTQPQQTPTNPNPNPTTSPLQNPTPKGTKGQPPRRPPPG